MIAATSNLNFCNPLTAVPQVVSALWSCLEPIVQKILSIVAYPITLLKNLFRFNSTVSDGVYFVRYINGDANLHRLIQATKSDIQDHQNGYQKGACLYTPDNVQPFSPFDPRHDAGSKIAVSYPFAFLIKPSVKLHYWSLQDMDRNMHRDAHEQELKKGAAKYKPNMFHNLFGSWKTIHFTDAEAFKAKIHALSQAVCQKNKDYTTAGGKKKPLDGLLKTHNEGSITYHPERDVEGILIRNTPQDIALAKKFKETYQGAAGNRPFQNVFLATLDQSGKIIHIFD